MRIRQNSKRKIHAKLDLQTSRSNHYSEFSPPITIELIFEKFPRVWREQQCRPVEIQDWSVKQRWSYFW